MKKSFVFGALLLGSLLVPGHQVFAGVVQQKERTLNKQVIVKESLAKKGQIIPIKDQAEVDGPGLVRLLSTTPLTHPTFDMTLKDNRLFVASQNMDPVYDVSDPYRPRLSFEIPHIRSSSSWSWHVANKIVDGRYYAFQRILDSGEGVGLRIWKISDGDADYLGGASGPGRPRDIDIQNNRLFAAWRQHYGSHRRAGFEMFDVSDPANINRIGGASWGYPYESAQAGHIAATSDGNQVFVGGFGIKHFYVSNPANPQLIARNEFISHSHPMDDIQLSPDTVISANVCQGIQFLRYDYVVNVIGFPLLTLENCPFLGPGVDQQNNMVFQVVGNRLYVVTSIDHMFKIFDITDLRRPSLLYSLQIPESGPRNYKIQLDTYRNLALIISTIQEGYPGGNLYIYSLSSR